MTATLLISTYNRPEALDVVLQSVARQIPLPDEIVIADDGSGEETKKLIKRWQESDKLPVKIKHIWQEDRGFRKSKILNKALAASVGDYIIQIDGDTYIHPKFMKDHLEMARPGTFIKGSRVSLDQELTEKICRTGKLTFPSFLSAHIIRHREKAFRNKFLRNKFEYFNPHDLSALGCNMAYMRQDAIDINGYDEEFEGWGHEDTDFSMRLALNGVMKRNLRYSALVYHLWHPQRGDGKENAILRDNQQKRGNTKARLGMDQYMGSPGDNA